MYDRYIITGAAGHLGQTIIRELEGENCTVFGLILPTEALADTPNTTYIKGDVTDRRSLDAFFDAAADGSTVVIHAAGIISIADHASPAMYAVNVDGTRNMIDACVAHGIRRLVYVSSVHALPELPHGQTIREVSHFEPEAVHGGYAKTKARASAAVMEAAKRGLDALIVHPSGIIGPNGTGGNHINQMVSAYILGKLPMGIKGGYDFVDVRDVARGCIAAARRGVCGECYILSNRYYTVPELFAYIRAQVGGARKPCLPIPLVKALLPLIGLYSKLTHTRALMTKYSLYTLGSNAFFSHEKADRELGYRTRDIRETIADTIAWIMAQPRSPKTRITPARPAFAAQSLRRQSFRPRRRRAAL